MSALLVGLPVIAARIWWSVAAAIAIFVVTERLLDEPAGWLSGRFSMGR